MGRELGGDASGCQSGVRITVASVSIPTPVTDGWAAATTARFSLLCQQ